MGAERLEAALDQLMVMSCAPVRVPIAEVRTLWVAARLVAWPERSSSTGPEEDGGGS